MITCSTENSSATKELSPYKTTTLGEYNFTSILSKALVAALAAEIEITDKLTWWDKAGAGNPVTYVQAFLNDYMYTALKFKRTYSPADWESFWKPTFMNYGYPPNILGFLFLKFYAAFQKNIVPKEIWTGEAYGALPGEDSGGGNGGDTPSPLAWAIGGTGVIVALGVGAFLLLRK